jgi:hypothetical protein
MRDLKMLEQYFPLGLAEGEAFIGRQDEIARLQSNIKHGYHTLLLAPRRHGKTSLAKKVITLNQHPWLEIDFFIAQSELSIEQKFIKGIQHILDQIDAPERWVNPLVHFFKNAAKTWTVGIKGMKLELIPEHHKDIPGNILEALNALEHILSKNKQRVILFLDEFQEIAKLENSLAIEGAIRHFAQGSKYVVFIFSGSSRHMLKHMFGDQSRPLYALCKEIHLDRLPPQEYQQYLNRVAKKTWGIGLSEEVFQKIMELTECHPRYVYSLCMYLWDLKDQSKAAPVETDVQAVWIMLMQERVKDFREVLQKRAQGQIKILSLMALNYSTEMTSQDPQSKLMMSSSAISQSLKHLEQEDYIERLEQGGYRIVDPMLKAILIEYGSDYFI